MSVQTLNQLLEHTLSTYNKPNLLRYRGRDGQFHNISTNEFKSRIINLALGLRDLGAKKGTKVTLLSENRPEWHVTDFACHLLGAVVVPIFPTLIPDQIEYIINNSESEFVLVSNQNQLSKILDIRAEMPRMKRVIVFDKDAATDEVASFASILETGRGIDDNGFFASALKAVEPDDLATIIYTSGTTGTPKGVMLTHLNFVTNVLDFCQVLNLTTDDLGLSFLPLCHAFERTVDYWYLYRGTSIVYSAGAEFVARDLEESSPTIMGAVPRFYEKIKSRIEQKAVSEGALKGAIFQWALKVGAEKANNFLEGRDDGFLLRLKYALAYKLVLKKIQVRTGGRLRCFISGGAPLSAEVAHFFYAAGLRILEGYGLTETSPVITVNPYNHPKLGTVGKALNSVEVKIAETGEILARGPNVMKGYYKMPEETRAVIENGWFHTGDIGEFDEDGYLRITDRIKQLMVTSVGKKVAPQPIEKEVENSRYIDQVVLIGEKRNFVSALIVPEFEALQSYAREANLAAADNLSLIRDPAIIALIQSELNERQKKFSDYERIRKFTLLSEPFTVENGKLTPTMKVRRTIVEKEYSDLIDTMYREAALAEQVSD